MKALKIISCIALFLGYSFLLAEYAFFKGQQFEDIYSIRIEIMRKIK